ncbi:MarR family transcriptional regulator [Tropicimonas sp.]|uniref:MarR family transcriptional regulator n=1 Tax=Tropicimonas sp. TaxID=2067044 RepID=UPI003A86428D
MKENSVESPYPELAAFGLNRFTPCRVAGAAQLPGERFARDYRKKFDISVPDWRVPVHLALAGGASVGDIEVRVAMDKVRVNSRVRRPVHLSLTQGDVALMADLLPVTTAHQAEIERKLGESFDCFGSAIDRILEEQR